MIFTSVQFLVFDVLMAMPFGVRFIFKPFSEICVRLTLKLKSTWRSVTELMEISTWNKFFAAWQSGTQSLFLVASDECQDDINDIGCNCIKYFEWDSLVQVILCPGTYSTRSQWHADWMPEAPTGGSIFNLTAHLQCFFKQSGRMPEHIKKWKKD